VGTLARSSFDLKRSLTAFEETAHVFRLPALLHVAGGTLAERIAECRAYSADTDERLAENQRRIDDIAFRLYGIDGEDRRSFAVDRNAPTDLAAERDDGEDEPADDMGASLHARPLTAALLSYAIGCALGRWDVRFATVKSRPPELPSPFDQLPVCPPGMLLGRDGLPVNTSPDRYPLRIDWGGIVADDPDHPDDAIRRVRDVLEVIWKDRADAIEKEACEILGVADLRDYFRKSGPGGFWDDHVKR